MTTTLFVIGGLLWWYLIAYWVCNDRSDDWLFGMCDPPSTRFLVWITSPVPPMSIMVVLQAARLGFVRGRRGLVRFCQWGGRCLFDRS